MSPLKSLPSFRSALATIAWYQWVLIGVCALALRLVVFYGYIQYEERYNQADSRDYHNCAMALAAGYGMSRVDNHYPIFWRTPGYPLFLKPFYQQYFQNNMHFSVWHQAHKSSLLVQIILCSLLPWFVMLLALSLTGSALLAVWTGWISVFHLGFVLASCFLLSDALALLLFIPFLLCFFYAVSWRAKKSSPREQLGWSFWAALFLGLYTWIRPNGQFVIVLSVLILLLDRSSWRHKFAKIGILSGLFFVLIAPWYIRNYQLTGHIFYCPMLGPYLQSFCAPKILRALTHKSLEECLRYFLVQVAQRTQEAYTFLQSTTPGLCLSRELICLSVALPWIWQHPFYFMLDWLKEVCKTAFDPYASQLVAFANNTYTFDPIEEFLGEKIKLCLWDQVMSPFMRFVCWLDFLFLLVVWSGIFMGIWIFILKPLWHAWVYRTPVHPAPLLWIYASILIGGMVFMTGGFGYARLRLPVEPLLIILSLSTWFAVYASKKENKA